MHLRGIKGHESSEFIGARYGSTVAAARPCSCKMYLEYVVKADLLSYLTIGWLFVVAFG
jgi:hypothetical protein